MVVAGPAGRTGAVRAVLGRDRADGHHRQRGADLPGIAGGRHQRGVALHAGGRRGDGGRVDRDRQCAKPGGFRYPEEPLPGRQHFVRPAVPVRPGADPVGGRDVAASRLGERRRRARGRPPGRRLPPAWRAGHRRFMKNR
ncbi:hypothetical protein G6F65_022657 [Rhizopus arrhizus]|nr:hypothetical protein G6F65_022657 [Rhizopus arrhizus]